MTQLADRVVTDSADIARLTRLIERLPDEGLVELVLVDGSRRSGVVTTRPSLQTFLDPSGREGINAILRFDDLRIENRSCYLWLDEILEIRPIQSDRRDFARPAPGE
ncbi:DUF3247 family protein [Lysobacter sp. BMK333-48F3]|uniref:DUF3247 family protein n=1 Tax=Lysobacter sp. BMK333-48F3 TaxID=2867962 RepID=UPI001C8C33BE|nr:DUF3247 family protein [Lysobacter sp. BMK333-48F3]MBX9403168.1 DUF3247 family protein [Lysobacter sp. BMK333-48F3]